MRLATALGFISLSALAGCGSHPAEGAADGLAERTADGEMTAPTPRHAQAILQAHFDHNPQCTPFFDMPRDVSAADSYGLRQMRAFAAAGVVEESGGAPDGQVRFILTPTGSREVRAGTGAYDDFRSVICYGTRKVEQVEVGTPDPHAPRVSVGYRYMLHNVPTWARSPEIREFYPLFGQWLNRRDDGDEVLDGRNGRWQLAEATDLGMFDFRQQGR